MNKLKILLILLITILFFSGCKEEIQKPNVLFIAIDDLRPELGCYGNTQIKSPNIDKLASEGLAFNRAYCQQAICMASRASIMSGYRPDTLQIYNTKSINDLMPHVLTLNQHFENNGYQIWASGKIYHHGIDRQIQFGDNYHVAKTEEFGRGYLSKESKKIVEEYDIWYRGNRNEAGGGRGPAYESPDVPDIAYQDGKMTDMAIDKLRDYKNSDKPFFMAVGYKKPHLPFNAPKKYWDLYNANKIEMASNMYQPENASEYFNYNFGELRNYAQIPKGQEVFDETLNRNLKHGYYACVSYTDAQIGRLIEELKKNGMYENTIIILWGDHGWKLGEHNMWCKHTQFELDNHVPLLIKTPGQTKTGINSDAFVEFVDMYPTLCELAGLETPAHLQGKSFAPVIDNPEREWKEGTISYWPMERNDPEEVVIGFTIKTDRYRYTEWIKTSTDELMAIDLFDHQTDPDENSSIANNPENEEVMKKLSKLLDKGKGWRTMANQLN